MRYHKEFIRKNEEKYCKGMVTCLFCKEFFPKKEEDYLDYLIPKGSPGRCDIADRFIIDITPCRNWQAQEGAMERFLVENKSW